MSQEIADFVKKHKANNFPENVKDPKDEKKSGDLGGYNLGTRDPESDKLAKKHTRHIHGSREGNEDPKDGVKDSLDDPKNKRLKGHGRNEKGDPMYEENWIQGAIKHPGALTKKAKEEEESPIEFAREHKHSSGKTGKESRLALTLKKMHHEAVEDSKSVKDSPSYPKLDPQNRQKTKEPGYQTAGDFKNRMVAKRKENMSEGVTCTECGKQEPCNIHGKPELDKNIKQQPKGKRLLSGDKLKEDTLANQIAINYLANRLEEKVSISGKHEVGTTTPDYTGGMEVNKTPEGETQTESKPITSKNEKSKKQNYKYGEAKKDEK